jgi:hypothetical protein
LLLGQHMFLNVTYVCCRAVLIRHRIFLASKSCWICIRIHFALHVSYGVLPTFTSKFHPIVAHQTLNYSSVNYCGAMLQVGKITGSSPNDIVGAFHGNLLHYHTRLETHENPLLKKFLLREENRRLKRNWQIYLIWGTVDSPLDDSPSRHCNNHNISL